jgi:hypothetical protein
MAAGQPVARYDVAPTAPPRRSTQAALVDAVSGVMVAALFVIAAGLVVILMIPALPLRSHQPAAGAPVLEKAEPTN